MHGQKGKKMQIIPMATSHLTLVYMLFHRYGTMVKAVGFFNIRINPALFRKVNKA